ncbi:MAG TPA: alpha/beta hydrolase, partial [Chloroflexota bacterium]|nr:alpha/beta hydrolase [Chloroflexota bacterium]
YLVEISHGGFKRADPAVGVSQQHYRLGDGVEKLLSLQERGDREGILATFTQEVLRMPAADFQRWRTDPTWQSRLAAAHTIPREIQARAQYRLDPKRFSSVKVPTLLLMGDRSPAFLQAATRAVHAALPNSELVVMPNQGHVAMDSAPGLFAHEVLSFLTR